MVKDQQNVLGEKLEICSLDPLTGWYRDGCCNTDQNDVGTHTITPKPEYNFEGLKNGDCWCVCAVWFKRAVDAGFPCKIFLKSTNKKTLEIINLQTLKKYAIDLA